MFNSNPDKRFLFFSDWKCISDILPDSKNFIWKKNRDKPQVMRNSAHQYMTMMVQYSHIHWASVSLLVTDDLTDSWKLFSTDSPTHLLFPVSSATCAFICFDIARAIWHVVTQAEEPVSLVTLLVVCLYNGRKPYRCTENSLSGTLMVIKSSIKQSEVLTGMYPLPITAKGSVATIKTTGSVNYPDN